MIYPIVAYGDPVLRKKAEDIAQGSDLKQLIEDMFETMYQAHGVGLAAPQIGKAIRLFIVDTLHLKEEEEEEADTEEQYIKKAFINPVIIETGGEEWTMEEGCLSIPDVRENVNRPERVKIRYFDEDWQLHEEEYDGFTARVILHEYDHIEGKLFIDYLSPLKKRLIKRKLQKIVKGEVNTSYPMKFAAKEIAL
ncbi:MAG: peptide deformylase [Thermonema sp.]|uniref:peptide deformylase n=1 Tax=Thermonema sp. TaxID=2231181 RepID=UPI0021DBBF7E|nr:peptide deformylase [Thermonema sp.]GIV39420.1 MAG: peptide deformylase [Thermonema sp.]